MYIVLQNDQDRFVIRLKYFQAIDNCRKDFRDTQKHYQKIECQHFPRLQHQLAVMQFYRVF